MNEEEKKDNSAPWINYRTDHAEQQLERGKKAANEDVNKAKGQIKAEVGDATGGDIKNPKEHIKKGKEREGKSFAEKYVKQKTPQTRLLEIDEKKQVLGDKKDLHLKSTSALTDPETAKQQLKDATKAKNFGKETPPSRGGFRGGGSPMMREPDETLKEKHKNTNPEDILSQKDKKPIITNPQQKQEQQQQQAKHQPNFKPPAPKSILDELPKDLLNSEKGKATLRVENAKQVNAEKTTKAPVVKEKQIQIAENKVKSQPPKGIKR